MLKLWTSLATVLLLQPALADAAAPPATAPEASPPAMTDAELDGMDAATLRIVVRQLQKRIDELEGRLFQYSLRLSELSTQLNRDRSVSAALAAPPEQTALPRSAAKALPVEAILRRVPAQLKPAMGKSWTSAQSEVTRDWIKGHLADQAVLVQGTVVTSTSTSVSCVGQAMFVINGMRHEIHCNANGVSAEEAARAVPGSLVTITGLLQRIWVDPKVTVDNTDKPESTSHYQVVVDLSESSLLRLQPPLTSKPEKEATF